MIKNASLLILLLAAGLAAETPAKPDSTVRVRKNWNSGWLFARQTKGTGDLGSFDRENKVAARVEPRFAKAAEVDYDDSEWQAVNLPHTWNAYDVMGPRQGYWRGIGWYRKHFQIDRKYAGKRIFLEFEGANSVAEFWLNGRKLGLHKGGYTGFEFDITGLVRLGEDNVLTAKVDNLYRDTLPPTVKTDYSFYGGIYRDSWLRVTDPVYVADAWWRTPNVSEAAAELTVQSEVVNRSERDARLEVTYEVLDADNKLVKSLTAQVVVPAGKSAQVTPQGGTVEHPRLWAPDTPNLYRIRTSIREGGALKDALEIPLGFRWFRFDPQQGFLLNGKRVQIQGVNWHQSYPGMGNALPNSRHVKDMELIRSMGGNFWRTSHYPHDPATLDASDRLGLLVWEELPINKEVGDPTEYIANGANMAREMISRDRNHPAIVAWGFAGEVSAPKEIRVRVTREIALLYRQLDPTRAIAMHEPRGDELEALADVSGLGVSPALDEKHKKYPTRGYMVGEYSASLSGRGIYGPDRHGEDASTASHERYLARLNQRPWMAGGCIWNMFDYDGETYDVVTPHVVAFGMMDIWRFPKEAYYFYQSQWSAEPVVHIVAHWTWPGQEGKSRKVKVYSNAEEVELFLNGRSLGKQAKGTAAGLANPPHIWEVPYEPGTLRAVAHVGQREISDERKTAGAPYQIILKADTDQLTWGDPESLAYITAVVADRAGTVVPDATNVINFTSYGPGELLAQNWPPYGTGLSWNAVAGMTRIVLRSTPRGGQATVSASSPGLKMGRIEVKVTAPGKLDEMNYIETERFQDPTGANRPEE